MTDERFVGPTRCDAAAHSPYWGEHVARYAYAVEHGPSGDILDIACGSGYGLDLLERRGRVIGADIDLNALQAIRMGGDRRLVVTDGTALPFPSDAFDLVTSFETIEHVYDRRGFVQEIARVLRPTGTLLLSTPNAVYTKPVGGVPTNPFHRHEYVADELNVALSEGFASVQLLGQTLSPRFRTPPFELDQRRLPRGVRTHSRLFGWKLVNKTGPTVREFLAQRFTGRPFYPLPGDYGFSPSTTSDAPVLVAVCREPLHPVHIAMAAMESGLGGAQPCG
ncbi:MAG: class I SAM-dependent methyltransferase [Acidimicrobiia bacterium]